MKLVIGRSIWLDPFGCYRYFDYLKEHYLKFSISKYLLENKLAVKNEYHLKNLFDKCKEAGLEIDNEVAVAKMVECVSISEKNVSPEKVNIYFCSIHYYGYITFLTLYICVFRMVYVIRTQ